MDQKAIAESTVQALCEEGQKIRRQVFGAEISDKAIKNADDFTRAYQEITTGLCWGYAWGRDGLDLKTRSIMNVAMLTALNRPAELKLHVRGAINNGVTVEEIKEILIQATIYCGVPAGSEGFRSAHEVLKEMGVLA